MCSSLLAHTDYTPIKWPIVKGKHININGRQEHYNITYYITAIFVLKLDNKCKFITERHYSDVIIVSMSHCKYRVSTNPA